MSIAEGASNGGSVSEWSKLYSDTYKRHYWKNKRTGKTSWTNPEDENVSDLVQKEGSAKSDEIKKDKADETEWKEYFSERYKRKYWKNLKTNVTTWEYPFKEKVVATDDEKEENTNVESVKDGKKQGTTSEMKSTWTMRTTAVKEGWGKAMRKHWYNEETKEVLFTNQVPSEKSQRDDDGKGTSYSPKTIDEYLPFIAYLEDSTSGANCMKKRQGAAGDEPKNDVFSIQSNMISLPKRYCYLDWSQKKVKEWRFIYNKTPLLYAVNEDSDDDDHDDDGDKKKDSVPSLILPDVFKSILLIDITAVYLDSNKKSFRIYLNKGSHTDSKDSKENVFQFFTSNESDSQAWVEAINFAKKIQKEVGKKKSTVKAKDLVDLREKFLERSTELKVRREIEKQKENNRDAGNDDDNTKDVSGGSIAGSTLRSIIKTRVMPAMKFKYIEIAKKATATSVETATNETPIAEETNENSAEINEASHSEEEVQIIGDSNTATEKKPQSIFTTIKKTLTTHLSPEKLDLSAATPSSPASPKSDIGIQTDDVIINDFAKAENKRLAKIMKGTIKYEKSDDNRYPDIRKTNLKILDRLLKDEQDFKRGIKTQPNLAYVAKNQAIKNDKSNIYGKLDISKWPQVYRPSDKTFKSAGVEDADVTYDKIYNVDNGAPSTTLFGSLKEESFATHDVKDWVLRYNKKYGRKYWQNTRTGHTSWTDPSEYYELLQEEKKRKSVRIEDIPVYKPTNNKITFNPVSSISEGSKLDEIESDQSDESETESKAMTMTTNKNVGIDNKMLKQRSKERLSIFDFDDSSVDFATNIMKLSALMQMPTLLVAHNKQLILMSISKVSLVLANNSNMKTIISIPLNQILSIDFDDNRTGLFRLLLKSNNSDPTTASKNDSDYGYLLFESVDKEGCIDFLNHIITAKLKAL